MALTRLCADDAKGGASATVAALCALLRTERNKVPGLLACCCGCECAPTCVHGHGCHAPHQAVRVALVRGLPWAADTMPLLLERTLDVCEDVRAAVYSRLHTLGVDLGAVGCVVEAAGM